MSPLRACAFLLPFSLALACAAKPAPVVEAPKCEPEPSITVSDPTPAEPMLAIPQATELVTLRLFVVSGADAMDEALPEPIRQSDVCKDSGCSLVLSPVLPGRNNSEMEIDIGNDKDDVLFSMQAKPRVIENNIGLELQARFLVEDTHNRAQHLEFSGALTPGEITHVGTFHASDRHGHVTGPQVFAVVERATPAGAEP